MPNTSPDAIPYPDSTSQVTPLHTWFANIAQATQTALTRRNRTVADLGALATQTNMVTGHEAYVTEIQAPFRYDGTKWIQTGVGKVATTAARDTAYARASAAYRVQGAGVYVTALGRVTEYYTPYNATTNPGGNIFGSSGWYYEGNSTDWVTGATGWAVATGWSITDARYKKDYNTVSIWITLSKGSGTVTAGGDGDISNFDLFRVPTALAPSLSNGNLSSASAGPIKSLYMQGTGWARMTAMSPGASVASGDVADFTGSYVLG